jgi:hypothetical protein
MAAAACQLAVAHQPTISDGSATTPDAAILFEDIQLSRVVYHEVTPDAEQIWIRFAVDEPQTLRVSLGVPMIERLSDFRPAFAVFGPGYSQVDLAFDVPGNLGGRVFETDGLELPEVFYEPFSQTSSWILREEDVSLPQAGEFFIVAYVPSGETGKLWIAPGVREEFSLGDIAELSEVLPAVQAFHETTGGGFPCFVAPAIALLSVLPIVRIMGRSASTLPDPDLSDTSGASAMSNLTQQQFRRLCANPARNHTTERNPGRLEA